ncbi:MAG: hypothetical protein ORN98_07385 [Alphaproteobacteria bacterium]|nr:hypothetical protein [Alphaproteobacteria bacterium]
MSGWRDPGGEVWTANRVVLCQSPLLEMWGSAGKKLLVSSVAYNLDADNGATTELELIRLDSFPPVGGKP